MWSQNLFLYLLSRVTNFAVGIFFGVCTYGLLRCLSKQTERCRHMLPLLACTFLVWLVDCRLILTVPSSRGHTSLLFIIAPSELMGFSPLKFVELSLVLDPL